MLTTEESTNSFEYRSNELAMRLPVYLRQKKRGILFFEASSKKRNDNLIHGFTIDVLSEDGVKFHRNIMTFENPQMNKEVMGVRMRLLRRGKPSYLVDGLEVLVETHISATDVTLLGYTVLFPLGSHNVYATFFGKGDISLFDASCKQIVSGVRLLEPGEAPLSSPMERFSTGGLSRTNTKTLKQALDDLPAEIAYLRGPILAVAKQDQDLLGSGEANTGSLERAIQKFTSRGNAADTAEAHADILRQWLLSLSDHSEAWASPAWFVEGFVRGSQWIQDLSRG